MKAFLFIPLFFFFGCNQKQKSIQNLILGEWSAVVISDSLQPPPPPGYTISGFNFINNTICDYKQGFFKSVEEMDYYERKIIFLGTKTSYKIENDSLKIYNLRTSSWMKWKIVNITPDTLTLSYDDQLKYYTKENYKVSENIEYDKIIVSSTGCFGICPESSTSIDKEGNIIFNGLRYTSKMGLYKASTDINTYIEIDKNFQKANIGSLKNKYFAEWTDDEEVNIVFVKNNQIVKSIRDYGRQSPKELYWAYTPIRFLYQSVDLSSFETKIPLPVVRYAFRTENKINILTESESFFLFSELLESDIVKMKFTPIYFIEYFDETSNIVRKIHTDGRFYQIDESVYDLEYNFLERNGFLNKFREIEEYDSINYF